jgi:transcriptional accessory protein Tex/SPT6
MRSQPLEQFAEKLHLSPGSTRDLLESLAAPGRDPRDDMPSPIFKTRVLKIEDMQPGMELRGAVLNVVDFGAFVDIGLKDSGLVHISQLANRYVKNPHEVVTVGDVVTVWVLSVDQERRRVSLTMIQPGTQRRPPEREQRPQPHDIVEEVPYLVVGAPPLLIQLVKPGAAVDRAEVGIGLCPDPGVTPIVGCPVVFDAFVVRLRAG